jgi:hypothetical protein
MLLLSQPIGLIRVHCSSAMFDFYSYENIDFTSY